MVQHLSFAGLSEDKTEIDNLCSSFTSMTYKVATQAHLSKLLEFRGQSSSLKHANVHSRKNCFPLSREQNIIIFINVQKMFLMP